MSDFVHLHVHTEFSLLDSLVRIPELVAAVAEAGMSAVAMTDSASLHGAPMFMREALRQGIRPIFGVEFEMAPRTALAAGVTDVAGPDLVVLAESVNGWQSLVQLVSEAHLQSAVSNRPVLSESALLRHCEGLLVLVGGNNGEITRLCRAGCRDEAVETLTRLVDALGRDRVFVELQNQRLPGQRELVAALREVARRVGVKCVATNNVHYLRPDEAEAHRCLRCVRRGVARVDDGAAYSSEFYIKRPDQMAAMFPDAPDALETTVEIAARCERNPWPPDTSRFPRYCGPSCDPAPVPAEALMHLAWAGFRRRWSRLNATAAATKAAERRLEKELEAAIQSGVANYLLVHADIASRARQQGITVVPLRGGTASSLLAWALELTDVLPTRWSLPSERFLNPDSASLPELSLDVPPHQRAELIALIRRVYGAPNVAHAGTLVAFGARSAVREVARALGVPADRLEELAAVLGESGRWEPRLDRREIQERLLERAKHWPELPRYAALFEGLPRSWAVHPSAIVIADSPVGSIVPLSRTPDGDAVTQFEVRDLSRFGLVRTDVPVSRTAALLGKAICELRKIAPEAVEQLERLDGREPEAAAVIRRGDVTSLPGVEASVVVEHDRNRRIRTVNDLAPWLSIQAADVAMLAAELDAALSGRRTPDVDNPTLQRLLDSTGGLLVFEEQAMRLLERLAGLSPAFSDLARRAELTRDDALRRRMWASARAGACRRGVPEEEIQAVWTAALECFRRRVSLARGAALATAAWRAAWIKARYPLVFYTAAVSAETGNDDRTAALLQEARARGIRLLGPDANDSEVFAKTHAGSIRLGWTAVRGVRPEAAAIWVAERTQHGPFRDFLDFARRLAGHSLNRTVLLHLVRAGAFDACGVPRGRLIAELDSLWAAVSAAHDLRQGQVLLFDMMPSLPATHRALTTMAEQWADERELLGVVVSPHPLMAWEWWLRAAIHRRGECEGLQIVTGVPIGMSKEPAGIVLDTLDGVVCLRLPASGVSQLVRQSEPVVFLARGLEAQVTTVGGVGCPLDEALRRVVEVRVLLPPGADAAEVRAAAETARRYPGSVPLRLIGAPRRALACRPVAVCADLVRALERCAGPRRVILEVDL